jgi:hypothetical protein
VRCPKAAVEELVGFPSDEGALAGEVQPHPVDGVPVVVVQQEVPGELVDLLAAQLARAGGGFASAPSRMKSASAPPGSRRCLARVTAVPPRRDGI